MQTNIGKPGYSEQYRLTELPGKGLVMTREVQHPRSLNCLNTRHTNNPGALMPYCFGNWIPYHATCHLSISERIESGYSLISIDSQCSALKGVCVSLERNLA